MVLLIGIGILLTRRPHRARIKRNDEVEPLVTALLSIESQFYTTPRAFFERYVYLFYSMPRGDWRAGLSDYLSVEHIESINAVVSGIPPDQWTAEKVEETTKEWAHHFAHKTTGPEKGKSGQSSLRSQSLYYMRWALTGGRPGPSLANTMVLLGRDVTLDRLETARIEFKAIMGSSEAHGLN